MPDEIPTTTEIHSLGSLRVAAERAISAGGREVTVDVMTLLALCRSEEWAHAEVLKYVRA